MMADAKNHYHPEALGISVYFANGTTVLLQTDSVVLSGKVLHQELFANGLALINVSDILRYNLPKLADDNIVPRRVSTKLGLQKYKRTLLKPDAISVAMKSNKSLRSQHLARSASSTTAQIEI